MTRAQRGYGDRWPDESRANDNTEMYGRFDGGWGTDERQSGRTATWGADGRMPDRRSEELRRQPVEAMPDRRSEELRRQPVEPMPDRHSEELRRLPAPRIELDPQPALDPVNPYAVVALVAGLLGLFPVAIVFGMLAFTHRGGRGLAVSALVLGALEIVGLVTAVLLMAHGSTSASAPPLRLGDSPSVSVSVASAGPVGFAADRLLSAAQS
jgi:hypothetical protein